MDKEGQQHEGEGKAEKGGCASTLLWPGRAGPSARGRGDALSADTPQFQARFQALLVLEMLHLDCDPFLLDDKVSLALCGDRLPWVVDSAHFKGFAFSLVQLESLTSGKAPGKPMHWMLSV